MRGRLALAALCSAALALSFLVALSAATTQTGGSTERDRAALQTFLECGRRAIVSGQGAQAAPIRSIRIRARSTPGPDVPGGIPSTRDISLLLPDRYKSEMEMMRPGLSRPARSVFGLVGPEMFQGDTRDGATLVAARFDDASVVLTKQTFARYALAWLLQTPSQFPMTLTYTVAPDNRATLSATGPDGFNMTMDVNPSTCLVDGYRFERNANQGDAMREAQRRPGSLPAAAGRQRVEAVEFLERRAFGSIVFPSRMKVSVQGTELYTLDVTDVQVNPPFAPNHFSLD